MFTNLEKLACDELFSTWINSMLEENGAVKNKDKRDFLKGMIGPVAEGIHSFEGISYFPDAEDLCAAEKDSSVFPILTDVLKKHTDVYALLPFTSKEEQIKRTEYCLRWHEDKPGFRIRYVHDRRLKFCPECLKEDLKSQGRKIVHVPHQLFVNVCWKHGCNLIDIDDFDETVDTNAASKIDLEKAVFMHDLYSHSIPANFDMTLRCIDNQLKQMGLTRQEAINDAEEKGYVQSDAPDSFLAKKVMPQISSEFYDFYAGFLTWMFGSAAKFQKALGLWDVEKEYYRNDFDVLGTDGVLIKFQCRTCGAVFYMHPDAAEYGAPCPQCLNKMSKVEIYQRYADNLDDGEYDVINEDGKIRVIHAECGRDRLGRFFSIIGRRSVCPVCKRKHTRNSHIGEQVGRMKIIDFKRADDVTVKMDDGTVVQHRHYYDFKHGIVTYTRGIRGQELSISQLRKDRIGERNINYQGIEMEITEYRNCRDIDIKFENGEKARHRKYADFQRGRIRCPSYIKEQRIGKENVNVSGFKMKIVEYRNTDDIDVEFETGDIVEHTRYEHFKRGEIGCPANHSSKNNLKTTKRARTKHKTSEERDENRKIS